MAQVIHISGNWIGKPSNCTKRPDFLAPAAVPRLPYLHEEGRSASFRRSGHLPAPERRLWRVSLFRFAPILVPYPHAWRYQKVNADYLAERGAAVILKDELLMVVLMPVIKDCWQIHPSVKR